MPIELGLKDDCPDIISQRAEACVKVLDDFYGMFAEDVQEAAKLLALAFYGEQRVLVAGLGLSAMLARVFAGRFAKGANGRVPLPVLALEAPLLTEDGGTGAEAHQELARQIEALGRDGDILVLVTRDGSHPALREACRAAREQNMFILGLTGGDGGHLAENDLLDLELRCPSIEEALVLEIHLSLVCLMDELVDYYLSGKPEILKEMLADGGPNAQGVQEAQGIPDFPDFPRVHEPD